MKRLVWILLALIGIPIVLTLIALAILSQTDPNTYKERVVQTISQQSGWEVQIGQLGWSFFPWLGLQAEQISLSNPQLPADDPARTLLRMDKADIKIKLLPLFSGNLQVGTLKFDRPTLIYRTDKQGRSNWQTAAAPAIKETTTDTNTTAPPLNLIDIDALVIDQARIQYQTPEQNWLLDPVTLKVKDIRLQNQLLLQPVHIELDLHANNGQQTASTQIDLQLKSPLSIQIPQQQISQVIAQLSPLEIMLTYQDAAYPQGIRLQLTGNTQIDLGKDQLSLQNLQIISNQAHLQGQVHISGLTQQPKVNAQLQLASFNLQQWLKQTLAIDTGLPSTALQTFSLSTDLTTDGSQLQLQKIQITLDDSHIQGDAKIADLSVPQPKIQANLQVDTLNLDRYVAPAANASQITSTQAASTQNSSALLPTEPLRNLNALVNLQITQMQYRAIPINNTRISLNANQGLIQLTQAHAELLEGNVNTQAQLDVRGSTPKLMVRPTIQQLQIHTLLSALQQKTWMSGQFNLQGEASTQGNTMEQLTQGLMSQLTVNIDKGKLNDFNLLQKVQSGLQTLAPLITQLLPGKQLPAWPANLNNQTEFNQLLANITIQNGQVQAQQLNAGLNQAQLQGSANWSLITNQGDLAVQINLAEPWVSKRLADVRWPLRCQINLTSLPSCSLDIAPIKQQLEQSLKTELTDQAKRKLTTDINQRLGLEADANTEQAAKDAAAAALKQQEEQAKQKAGEKLNKALDKLFK